MNPKSTHFNLRSFAIERKAFKIVPSALRSLALIELRNSNENVKLGEINSPLGSLEEIAHALEESVFGHVFIAFLSLYLLFEFSKVYHINFGENGGESWKFLKKLSN